MDIIRLESLHEIDISLLSSKISFGLDDYERYISTSMTPEEARQVAECLLKYVEELSNRE